MCVFCGASPGSTPEHLEAARELAHAMHKANANLIYGGGTVGVMGEVAKTLVSLSGPEAVHGVIPYALLKAERKYLADGTDAENQANIVINEKTYGKTTVVKDMHERKGMMAKAVVESGVGSGFVALSGGYGTLEELMEMTTWNQLGIHDRGIVVYNVAGHWDGLLQWVNKAVETGFVTQENKSIMVEAKTAQEVIDKLRDYENSPGRLGLDWKNK